MRKTLLTVVLFFSFLLSWSQVNTDYKSATGKNGMVVSARVEATKAGLQVLMDGGNAFDAAVAVHFVLAVVYPQAGNIGGGGFMVAHLSTGENVSLDFREMAPAAATRDMYLDEEGNVITKLSLYGHLAVGVPGSVNGIETMHKRYGTKPWKELLQPAIELAENGFVLTPLDAEVYNNRKDGFMMYNPNNDYFQQYSKFHAGDKIIQKDLAKVLTRIAEQGKSGFYEGETADLFVKEMEFGKGLITHDDLKNYQSKWRSPLMGKFRGYEVVTMPPPSSGGVALLQMLYMLEKKQIKKYKLNSAQYVSLVVEAERLAYADRSEHLGDPDFYPVNVPMLLDKNYLNQRSKNIQPLVYTPSDKVKPGIEKKEEGENTTHYSIVDQWGNAVSITTTLNSKFGSHVFVTGAGFVLNNEMDDFSAKPGVPNQYGLLGDEANAIAPGKRMLSSMTPTIVLKNNQPVLVTGTPGGATIITSVLQTVLQTLVYNLSPSSALAMPKFHHQWFPDVVYFEESWQTSTDVLNALQAVGYKTEYREPIGRVEIILKKGATWQGAGDPRGDDAAAGF